MRSEKPLNIAIPDHVITLAAANMVRWMFSEESESISLIDAKSVIRKYLERSIHEVAESLSLGNAQDNWTMRDMREAFRIYQEEIKP